jgi:DNA primase
MENPVEEIKKRIDVIDFIGSFIALKKSGRNFKGLCPFHQEKTPSFIISPDRQIWHCFGACQEGGDVIKFLMKWENITFYEALKELAEKLGIRLRKVTFEDRIWKKKERLFTINGLACEFYHYLLTKHNIGIKALDYLKNRKISRKIIDSFSLGYSPSSWDSLLKFLKKKDFNEEECYEAGLLVKSERGSFYDRFRKRLMFALKDPRGNVLGFSGRILDDKSEAKYVNTPETPVYHKRETLFGINLSKEAIKKNNQAILVEGEFDMISCFQEGIANTVAVKGSAVTKEQLMLIKRYANKIVLSLDADFSGEETTKRAIVDAENLDFDIKVVTFDFAKDPDEAIKKDAQMFKKIIEKPIPVYDFIIDLSTKKNKGGDAFSKKSIGNEVIPFIADIINPIVQSHYVKKLAEILDVETSVIGSLIKKQLNKKRAKQQIAIIKIDSDKDRYQLLQTYILSLIFQNDKPFNLYKKIFSVLEEVDFSIMSYKKLIHHLSNFNSSSPDFKSLEENWREKFASFLPKELVPVFNELTLFDIAIFDENILDKKLDKIVYEFKRLSLKRRIKDKNAEIEEVKKLTEFLSEVEKKLIIL